MVIIHQEEIVEITADFPCRFHGCKEIKLLPVGKCREQTRQHILLDPCRQGKLRFNPGVFHLFLLHFLILDTDNDKEGINSGDQRGKYDKLESVKSPLYHNRDDGQHDVKPEGTSEPFVHYILITHQKYGIYHKHQKGSKI